jgi:hypothetical protein
MNTANGLEMSHSDASKNSYPLNQHLTSFTNNNNSILLNENALTGNSDNVDEKNKLADQNFSVLSVITYSATLIITS